ncbi:group-specific protein [Bacillus pseudomycoides]|uniref:nucleoside 2-deoxyribosyltransferase n=1 Tax=Bacillus pseudomycoides TaxID=64104 RepID=UPI000BECCB0A|nr:nucleoside 2-deoxyribosyltransferase [Bacillus pseudomycoides]PDY00963.1 group-specific protein [Bacillus pseudomycoides]PEK81483.1 group-specific protein [Bacillus pseudomycoides]PEN11642.1 group-specific protein [Bacillus pseudomycoides]PGB90512.1 group-specific protein [Bacillus pseudomycoides]
MNFYIASSFQNKHLVQFVASQLKEAGWHHTYNWTQNERATNREQLQKIGQAEKQAIQNADVFLLLLDGGNGSHTELGMAIALKKKIYMYHKNNPLQTTFYHLPEVDIFQGEVEEFVSYVMNKGDA